MTTSTGTTALSTALIVSTLIAGTGSVFRWDRADEWKDFVKSRISGAVEFRSEHPAPLDQADVRTTEQHLANIREVLRPSISDLADLLSVSRQAIYKWISGASTPEEENKRFIITLSHAADAFKANGIVRPDVMLTMKIKDDKSLLELLKEKLDCGPIIDALIAEAKTMEQAHQISRSRFVKSAPNDHWIAALSIPGNVAQD